MEPKSSRSASGQGAPAARSPLDYPVKVLTVTVRTLRDGSTEATVRWREGAFQSPAGVDQALGEVRWPNGIRTPQDALWAVREVCRAAWERT